MSEYQVVEADSAAALADKVRALLAEGWQLVGGVAVYRYDLDYERASWGTGERFYQAMAR